jgi:hypothetical protein
MISCLAVRARGVGRRSPMPSGLPGRGADAAWVASERQFLRFAIMRLGHLFPYPPKQPGYNKRLRALAPAGRRLGGVLDVHGCQHVRRVARQIGGRRRDEMGAVRDLSSYPARAHGCPSTLNWTAGLPELSEALITNGTTPETVPANRELKDAKGRVSGHAAGAPGQDKSEPGDNSRNRASTRPKRERAGADTATAFHRDLLRGWGRSQRKTR